VISITIKMVLVMVLIASWNINSVKARLDHLIKFLKLKNPDIVLLQETKCQKDNFPYESLGELGYNIAVVGQKSYNGVAILSKSVIEDIVTILPEVPEIFACDARYIEGFININGICMRIASVYVPHGTEVGSPKFLAKLQFLEKLRSHIIRLGAAEENIIIGGDLNVAPEDIDVYNPKSLEGSLGFHIEERIRLRAILNSNLFDTYRISLPDVQEFSWWDYRRGGYAHNKGMRIDHLLASVRLSDKISEVEIFKEARGWDRPSDHVPVLCKLD